MKKIYLCADSLAGIFSAVYEAWKSGEPEEDCSIELQDTAQQQLFCRYVEVKENEQKSRAVEKLIRRHLGEKAYHDICRAILSEDDRKAEAVLQTMFAARHLPDSRKIMEHLANPEVRKVFELSRRVGNEAHLTLEFIRFRELDNGVLYAPITPENRILTCVAPHFADRLPMENWLIHDRTHQMFAVHASGKNWFLLQAVPGEGDRFESVSGQERQYASLWKNFFHTISISERNNPACQRGHLPLRYRPNMTEFQ